MAAPTGLARIETNGNKKDEMTGEYVYADSAPPVRAQTIEELHSLQIKRSTPTTPIKDGAGATPFASALSEEQQLESIRC